MPVIPGTSVSSAHRLTDGIHHFAGINTRQLVRYVRHELGDAAVALLLADAGEARPAAELEIPATWSSYHQFRSLLEASGRLLGDRAALASAGANADLSTPVLAHVIVQLGSVDALYEHIAEVYGMMTQLATARSRRAGDREWLVDISFPPGYEPFEEYCWFCRGIWSVGPAMFGHPLATVDEVQCRCHGGPVCRFRVTVEDHPKRESRYWRFRAQIAELHIGHLERTAQDLMSGVDLDAMLRRSAAAAAEALGATGALLELDAVPAAPRQRYSHGMDPDAIEAVMALAEHPAVDRSDRPPARLSVPVSSNGRSFGRLTVVRHAGGFLPPQRSDLESYALGVAAALDAATALHQSHEGASQAEALLDLARALAEVSTSLEMAERLVRAVPAVIDCDRAVVTLVDVDGVTERFVATHGLPAEIADRLLRLEIPPGATPSFATRHFDPDDPDLPDTARAAMAITGSLWSMAVPILVDTELAGRIVVSVTHDPDRLKSPRLEPRLQGLAAQASTALRNARLLDRVRHQALHDPLTGLANRALILDRLEHLIARSRRTGQSPAVLFIDLDGFKEVNDAFGHLAGDALIRQAAARIEANARTSDTVGRLGGDEFVVLLESALASDGVELVADRLLSVLNEPYNLSPLVNRSTTISASIGISLGDRASAAELLRDADIALYRAKEDGKARYSVFAPEARDAVDRNLALRSALFEALDADQLFLVYQPEVDLTNGAVTGAEALLRWRHPDWGVLPPDRFLPTLEETGMIGDVGRWVLRRACEEAAGWAAAGTPLGVAVNVSPLQVASAQLVTDVGDALAASGLTPCLLTIEVTESVLMRDIHDAVRCLGALRRLGVRVAIDDFGTGYSSLAYLREFPADQLKIDRAFVATLEEGGNHSSALVHAMVQLGKALGLRTVAEGVERSVEHRMLRHEECDAGQGYFFAPPLEAEEFTRRFVTGRRPADGEDGRQAPDDRNLATGV